MIAQYFTVHLCYNKHVNYLFFLMARPHSFTISHPLQILAFTDIVTA